VIPSSSVCGTQPIFGAIESTAPYGDVYAPRCACTMRNERARTSGKNFFDLFMAIFSRAGASSKAGAVQLIGLAIDFPNATARVRRPAPPTQAGKNPSIDR
jgi:hypothetical protein